MSEATGIAFKSRSSSRRLSSVRLFVAAPWVRGYALAWIASFLFSSILLLSEAAGDRSALSYLPLDDSWIHLVYTRALVTQGCLCYNDGIWEAGSTSWGWVLINAPAYLIGVVALGLNAAIVIKLVGISVFAAGLVALYYLAKRISHGRVFPWLVSALVVAEPTFAYHRVSGMEGPIIFATAVGAVLALLNDRRVLGGVLLGAAFWARPESGVFVAATLIAYGATWTMQHWKSVSQAVVQSWIVLFTEDPKAQARRAVASWMPLKPQWTAIWVPVIPAFALLIWVSYNMLINGTIYPNTYIAKHDFSLPFIPFGNIARVVETGMMDWQPWLGGWLLPISICVILVGVWFAYRRGGFLYLGLASFIPGTVLAVGKGQSFGDITLNFFFRRYVDPVVPLVILFLAFGVYVLLTVTRPNVFRETKDLKQRMVFLVPIYAIVVTLLLVTAIGTWDVWRQMHHDYSWNARNVTDEDVAAGKWLAANADADASVLIADAGAIRYWGERFTIDSIGLNFHEAIGRDWTDVLVSERPNYAAIWSGPGVDGTPNATRHQLFTTPKNTILGGGPVGIYEFDWSEDLIAPPEQFYLDSVEGTVIDQIDLANRESEVAHDYFLSFVSFAPWTVGGLGDRVVVDRGLSHSGEVSERFVIDASPGRDLILVGRIRLNDAEAHPVTVFVDGEEVGELDIEPSQLQYVESSVRIPGEFIESDQVQVELNWDFNVTQFRWWAVIPE